MLKPVSEYLTVLLSDLRNYRSSLNRLFSRKLTLPRHCAGFFFKVLASTSRLYGDFLTLREMEPKIPARAPAENCRAMGTFRSAMRVEFKIRERFSRRVESLPCWSSFHARNAFADENRLRTRADYIERLVLHLPEIYGETIGLEGIVQGVIDDGEFSDAALAGLLVGLEHVAHHASYCRHALEILSSEYSWMEPLFTQQTPDGGR
jgi:hypothetical protein